MQQLCVENFKERQHCPIYFLLCSCTLFDPSHRFKENRWIDAYCIGGECEYVRRKLVFLKAYILPFFVVHEMGCGNPFSRPCEKPTYGCLTVVHILQTEITHVGNQVVQCILLKQAKKQVGEPECEIGDHVSGLAWLQTEIKVIRSNTVGELMSPRQTIRHLNPV